MRRFSVSMMVTSVASTLMAIGSLVLVISGQESGWTGLILFSAGTVAALFASGIFTTVPNDFILSLQSTYPKPAFLRSNRLKAAVLGLCATAIALLFARSTFFTPSSVFTTLFLGAIWILFSAVSIVLIYSTYRPAVLRLDTDGFELSTMLRTRNWRWGDVSDFSVVQVRAGKGRHPKKNSKELIGFDVADSALVDTRWKYLTGRNTCMYNHFDCSHDELVALLNFWLSKSRSHQ